MTSVRWVEIKQAALYKLELKDTQRQVVLSALLQSGVGTYRAPSWLKDRAIDGNLIWHLTAIDFAGNDMQESVWRKLRLKNIITKK